MNEKYIVWLLTITVFIGIIGDLCMTVYGMSVGLSEGNPIIIGMANLIGYPLALLLTFLMSVAGIYALYQVYWIMPERVKKFALFGYLIMIIVRFMVIGQWHAMIGVMR